MNSPRRIVVSLLALTAAACVETRDPPKLPKQVEVAYGPKVFLVEGTQDFNPRGDKCTRLGSVATSSTATITAADGRVDNGGAPLRIDRTAPHNCYVEVKPKRLKVDVVEVTNELFQLCVDSGVCEVPDPSKAGKAQACSDEERFDTCPVAEVTQHNASVFCQFIGRRLPSSMEHLIARQVEATQAQDPTQLTVYPTGDEEPATCEQAVVGTAGCKRPQPMTVTEDPEATAGAAKFDVAGGIFDLTGNMAEWASDLFPAVNARGTASGLPWFCSADLPPNAGGPPVCPTGARCVRGQYAPAGYPLGDYPVCITFSSLRALAGAQGALYGGSFFDEKAATPPKDLRDRFGVFARRAEPEPEEAPDKHYGFRCAGDGNADDAVEPAN